jgi:hypothetical protein
MQLPAFPSFPRRTTFGDLSAFIRARLKQHQKLRVVSRSDFNQLVSLESEMFPNTTGIFDIACVRHATHYFNYSILIGKSTSKITSYLSFFPLTKNGFEYCIEENVKTICHFPAELFKPRRHYVHSIFLEVIATTPDCPFSIKRDTIEIAVSLLRKYSYLPFLSCPVSKDGLHILNKLGFTPIKSEGLNTLYIRNPQGEVKS